MTKKDHFYFTKAKEIAELSNFKRVHIGCVIVYHGTILAYGCNEDKTDTIQYVSKSSKSNYGISEVNITYKFITTHQNYFTRVS